MNGEGAAAVAKWGPLRGEDVEIRELAAVLRAIADQHGKTVRGLAMELPYPRSVISANLNGSRRPDWPFVEAFLRACVGSDQYAFQMLKDRVRLLWQAADPHLVTSLPQPREVLEEPTGEVIPAEVLWRQMAALEEIADKQQTVARAKLSVTRQQALATGLLEMLGRLSEAVAQLNHERDALREERDALRGERGAGAGLEEDLARIRRELLDTQQRLEAAERLYAHTSQRLDQAERQRVEAERLKDQALDRLRTALQPITPESLPPPQPPGEVTAAEPFTSETDQQMAAEVLSRVDDLLAAEAAALGELRQGWTIATAPADIALTDTEAGRSASPAPHSLPRFLRSLVGYGAAYGRPRTLGLGCLVRLAVIGTVVIFVFGGERRAVTSGVVADVWWVLAAAIAALAGVIAYRRFHLRLSSLGRQAWQVFTSHRQAYETQPGAPRPMWQAFTDGVGGALDLLGGTQPTHQPSLPFEATLADEVHQLCLVQGLVPTSDSREGDEPA